MADSPDAGGISDTIVVGGNDYLDDSQDEDMTDGSIYGEEEEDDDDEDQSETQGQPASPASPAAAEDAETKAPAAASIISKAEEQEEAQAVEAEDIDYAMSFESPASHHQSPKSPKENDAVARSDDDVSQAAAPSEASDSIMTDSNPPPGLPLTNGSASAASESKNSPSPILPPSTSAPTTAASEELIRALVASASATAAASAAAAASSSSSSAPNKAAEAPVPASSDDEDDGADSIQKLVDDITRRASSTAASSPPNQPASQFSATNTAAGPQTIPASALPSSLPPKPSVPKIPPQPHYHSIASPTTPHGNYMSAPAGVPGAANDAIPLSTPPNAAYPGHHMQNSYNPNGPQEAFHNGSNQRAWETFLQDENRYTSEQNWDRFPEGSRIFIGNLSSDRVSKREVFNYFSKFGRLAQISLKSAYGFVQYHTIAEGQACLLGAQGMEMGGRKIHLEISRAQKKKDKEDREKPPDRQNFHGGRERFDNRNQAHGGPGQGWKRDDFRSGGRSPSPNRNNPRGGRDGFYGRDRGFGHDRRRSQSPARHKGNESYRRRSPSPHRRTSSTSNSLDIPRRYGNDIPDVQILLLQEVSREFVTWVTGALHNRGLRTDVMYLNPRFPRKMVMERQVLEGVHAIIDLDYNAQAQGKINLQLFIRAPGTTIRFEEYNSIDPPIAAELVLREKSKAQPPPHAYPPQSNNGYGHQYPPQAAPAPYQQPYHQAAAVPPAAHVPAAPAPAAPDLSALIGQIDNSTLQTLLASLQPQQQQQQPQAQAQYGAPQHPVQHNMYSAGVPTPAQAVAAYPSNPADAAQHLQSIMKNLKRVTD
ncbi:hypothetical protein QBC38DRAFT_450869 [Podospora fimiseda]|uniref:RRM domain-containing protein n=1 Tax=Podospora fimiseda TaxID=252190 RepID=A0AAN7BZ09_9PEZI|nr:hypothetical protein QBC38DRAFT_450869 [Podospora fimiseda]